MAELKKKNLLIVQRVLTQYRFELFSLLKDYFNLTIATSKGDKTGSLKLAKIPEGSFEGVNIKVLNSIKLKYTGESRSTHLFFYPQIVRHILSADIILLEGATNLLNNIYIVPIARLFGKKIIWMDAGYSPEYRTKRRIFMDNILGFFVRMTHLQFAYSSNAQSYMRDYMCASNCKLLLNTINTQYHQEIEKEINDFSENYVFDSNNIRLLFVGAIESRKKVIQLVEMVESLNQSKSKKFQLHIIGSGPDSNRIKQYIDEKQLDYVKLYGAIYDKNKLKDYYLNSDLLILPGDGGLAIVQSIMFNLPVLCVSADGTEYDYLEEDMIFSDLNNIKMFLKSNFEIRKVDIIKFKPKLYSSNWVNKFNEYSMELLNSL